MAFEEESERGRRDAMMTRESLAATAAPASSPHDCLTLFLSHPRTSPSLPLLSSPALALPLSLLHLISESGTSFRSEEDRRQAARERQEGRRGRERERKGEKRATRGAGRHQEIRDASKAARESCMQGTCCCDCCVLPLSLSRCKGGVRVSSRFGAGKTVSFS